MNAQQAAKALKKALGQNACWRIDEGALTGEQRAIAKEEAAEAAQAVRLAQAVVDERRAQLLADPEYVRLKSALAAVTKNKQSADGKAHRRRITVGLNRGMFFVVRAEGDNWQEVVDKLTKEQV